MGSSLARLVATPLLGVLILAGTPAFAQRQLLATLRDGGLSTEAPPGTGWCGPTAIVTARGDDEDVFRDVTKIARIADATRRGVMDRCPQATSITINGFVDDIFVYRATMVRPQQPGSWPLVEVAVSSVDDLPEPPEPLPNQQVAQQAPRVEAVGECDAEAAHPDDPTKPPSVRGVTDDQIHAGRALQLCEEAHRREPSSARIKYQLARALMMYDRPAEGIALMTEAAEEGHPVAIASLGDIALYGLLDDQPDPELARELYRRAAAGGFRPAERLAAEITDNPQEDVQQAQPARPQFRAAQRMAVLLRGQAIGGTGEPFFQQTVYGFNVTHGMRHHCPGVPILSLPQILNTFSARMGGLLPAILRLGSYNEGGDARLQQIGLDDGYALAFTEGCNSQPVRAVSETMRRTMN